MSIDYSNKKTLIELDKRLTETLISKQVQVLQEANTIRGQAKNLQPFHAEIGGKNNIFADCIRMKFSRPSDFIRQWITGLIDDIAKIDQRDIHYHGTKLKK